MQGTLKSGLGFRGSWAVSAACGSGVGAGAAGPQPLGRCALLVVLGGRCAGPRCAYQYSCVLPASASLLLIFIPPDQHPSPGTAWPCKSYAAWGLVPCPLTVRLCFPPSCYAAHAAITHEHGLPVYRLMFPLHPVPLHRSALATPLSTFQRRSLAKEVSAR